MEIKRLRPFLWGGLVLILILIVLGRFWRQAKSDAQQDSYTDIVSVKGFVLAPEPYVRYIEESGVLAGNKESLIAAETGGRVLAVNVDVGGVVRAGDPLVRLDDELYRLEADRAKIAYDKAKMDLERIEKLYEQKSISETDRENARLSVKGAEVQYRMALKTCNDATIRAPFGGTIAAKLTEVGQMLERGMPVVQLVDISTLKLTVQVSEKDVQRVTGGASAIVIVDAVSDTVPGTVAAVGTRATTGSRTFPVELRVPNDDRLRSGMFARAIIAASTIPDGLLVPRTAILPDVGNMIVFVARGATAQKIDVRVVGTRGDRVAVEGLARGDTVITVGNQSLSEGTLIDLTLEASTAP